MTWWLWLVLVLAALAVFAVLGVGLWRRGKALLAELQQLGAVAERLSQITGVEPPPPVVPGYLLAPGELSETRHRRERNLRARRLRRAERGAAAVARWQQLGLR
ncbi:MAG TPA: hypothetical protein VK046_05280 [Actinomycetaceae bacterium]|nr:hypothetical protein [Actinomycetaceae bacterium]